MPIKIMLMKAYRKFRSDIEEARAKIKTLSSDNKKLSGQLDTFDDRVEERVDERISGMNISRQRFEDTAADRGDLIELYTERIFAQACCFAQKNMREQLRRGLFILLIDQRNMDPQNFSDFHESQQEYLENERFQGIEGVPHIFSPSAAEALEWMGEKEIRLDENGEIIAYEERDGAILVDLRGVMIRTRQMIEGVRTHKADSSIDQLLRGGARHNAAVYASSLKEVLSSVVVSEETNCATQFHNGRIVQMYNPYKDRFYSRDEYYNGQALCEQTAEAQELA